MPVVLLLLGESLQLAAARIPLDSCLNCTTKCAEVSVANSVGIMAFNPPV